MNTRTIKRAAVCACACAAIAVGSAVADDAPTPPDPVTGAGTVPVPEVQPDVAARFAELRRERTSADDLPAEWRAALARTPGIGTRWGANPDLARRSRDGAWLIPGDGHVCLANLAPRDGSLGLSCAATAGAEQGLLAPSDVDAGGTGVVTGVVPDGVDSVVLVGADGAERRSPAGANTYRAGIDARLAEVRFTDSDGTERVLPMGWNPR